MMEYVDKMMEEILSEVIVGTCQLLPKSNEDPISDRFRVLFVNNFPSTFQKPKTYSMQCGSSAEFYIRPLNPLIYDLDMLIWLANRLACVEDFPVLPTDLSKVVDTIQCLKIEQYLSYPGFVRLRLFGEMNYDWKCKKYSFRPTTLPNQYHLFKFDSSSSETVRGPSIRYPLEAMGFTKERVRSVWCPQWPKEAKDWPRRQRDYGWPTIDIISEVVQHGCHVVYVQHRACRNDKLQWRLSFSVAEVILLQSWTQIQQIVYHMLRFLSNKELIQKDCPKEDEVLCTYHLKTLMLWTCEEMSPDWWNSSSVIAICCELLHKLSKWLKMRYCPNYFIPEANLFHDFSSTGMYKKIEGQLNEFCNSSILCVWFLENYIQLIADNIESPTKIKPSLVDIMLHVFGFRKKKIPNSLNILFGHECAFYNEQFLYQNYCKGGYAPISLLGFLHLIRDFELLKDRTMSILPIPDNLSCFMYFDITLFSLHARNGLACGRMSWDGQLFVEYMKGISLKHKIVRCQYHNFPEPSASAGRSQLQFLQAQKFLENLTGSNSHSEFQILAILSKEFLRKTLECDDSQTSIITPAALTYLAALHFATSENKIVMELCSAVLMDQTTHMEHDRGRRGKTDPLMIFSFICFVKVLT